MRYIGGVAVPWIKTINRSLSDDFRMQQYPNFGRQFILVTLSKHEMGVHVTINCEVKANKKATFNQSFQSVTETVKYMLGFLPKLAIPILAERFSQNVTQLKQIDEAHSKFEDAAKSAYFKEDQAVKRWRSMEKLRNQIIDILSNVVVLMHTEEIRHCSLLEEVNMELLRQMCMMGQRPRLSCSRGRISVISPVATPLEFKTLPYIASSFTLRDLDAQAMFEIVRQTIHELWNEFEVDFLTCNTPAQIGRLLLSRFLNVKHMECMYSPCKEIQVLIEKQSRFGLLACKKGIIEDNSNWKSGCHVDFSKYYSGILKNFFVMLGRPLIWIKGQTGKFEITRSRSRATLANLLILLIEHVTESVALFAMYGKEKRHNFPVDAEITWPDGTKKILSVAGCLWHGHSSSVEGAICHAPRGSVSQEHVDKCNTCKNAELAYDNLRPNLFRLRENETNDSPHPFKKDMTFQQVFEESQKNLHLVSQNPSGISVLVIHECDVLKFYYSPITEFLRAFGLPARSDLQNAVFADVYRNVASQYFPLLRKDNLSKTTLIECIKSGKVHGLVIVTAKMGKLSSDNIGILAPFVMKGEDGNEATCDIENALVPTSFLRFLLNFELISDFQILDIQKLFEYNCTQDPIFSSAVHRATKFMDDKSGKKEIVNLLKQSLNSSLGHFGVQTWKYPNSIITTEQEMSRINPWENLQKTVSLDQDHAILFTSKKPKIINLAHIHLDIIYHGRQEMLRFLLSLKHFLHVDVSRVNTDGAIVVFQSKLSETELRNQTSVALDRCLRSRDVSHLRKYLEFKKEYFSDLGICEGHEKSYIEVLSSGQLFYQSGCCLSHVHVPNYKKLKIEGFFDRGVIHGVNQLATFNTTTKQNIVKCSGARIEKLYKMHELSNAEFHATFPH